MSVEDEKVLELQHRKEKIFYGGGAKAIEKQKAMGKLTARERIIALLDEGSFHRHIRTRLYGCRRFARLHACT